MRWLQIRFHAPLASFGGETIDVHGVIRDFPAQSMLTGLFANALGWTRAMRVEHQELQDRIIYGVLHEEEPTLGHITDYQTAQLSKSDKSWTTRGVPAGRAGGAVAYTGAHQRWRDYHADLRMLGVIRLNPIDAAPTLDDLANALEHPARPLFIGRKPCLPSAPIFSGWIEAPDMHTALRNTAPKGEGSFRALWPASEGTENSDRTTFVTDERNWITGLHGGARHICEGRISSREDEK